MHPGGLDTEARNTPKVLVLLIEHCLCVTKMCHENVHFVLDCTEISDTFGHFLTTGSLVR